MITTKQYIKQVRDLTGFSDYKIAKTYNINQSNFSKYSSGKSTLSDTHAFLIAEILNLDPAKILANAKLENAKNNNNESSSKFWQQQLKNIQPSSDKAKITISQFNPTVGAIEGNTKKIIEASLQASKDSDIVVFPELAICGYQTEDLLTHKGFREKINKYIKKIAENSHNITIILGAPNFKENRVYNSAYILQEGKIINIYNKRILPNYGIFDEKRYFTAGYKPCVFNVKGKIFALVICEDTWSNSIIKENKELGANTIISINSSPFSTDKHQLRIKTISALANDNNIEIIYINSVGGQDGVVFDGGSFIADNIGRITHQLPLFMEKNHNIQKKILSSCTDDIQNIYQALVLGFKDYYKKNDVFSGVLVSLSGGIDSALTLAIAIDAIEVDKVKALMMPYKYTSNNSLSDARDQVKMTGVDYKELNIYQIMSSFESALSDIFVNLEADATEENMQARSRGTLAMAVANKENRILLTTGNKSEMAVGYTTLYGDMAGGYAPIKDVYKTLVYKLAKYRNSINKVIPDNVLIKEPSAELSPNQLDADSLPPYNVLDEILSLFIEKQYSVTDIIDCGFEKEMVDKVIKMVKNNEYKRHQSAIGTKITRCCFDKDRRYPLTNLFNF